ncbi:tetratricopeptide repeat protein [Ensifer sp. NPDC090286]|uniref:tetratricopeptide repeat protein n=1 Tax=Ensifer sp. NPDC090286 TaxID=3363991 RepID=UPI00383B6EEF
MTTMRQGIKQIPGVFEFHPDESSKKLIVYFSSASAKRLEGVSQIEKYRANKLFIRDPGREWYNGPVEDIASGPEELCECIQDVVALFDNKDITFAGSSMGAYGAILFGALLDIPRIVAIAPQVVIHPLLPNSPRQEAKYPDLASLLKAVKPRSKIKIWFGCGELLDVYQSMRCQDIDNCEIYGIPNSLHNVLAHFKSLNLVERFFDHAILGKPFDFQFADLNGIPLAEICVAIDKAYLEGDALGSNDVLKGLVHPLLTGALAYQIGLNHKKASENEAAIEALTEAVKLNPRNYDAFFALGGVCLSTGDFDGAIRNYALAIEFFPGKNVDYVTQLAGAYRLKKDYHGALMHIHGAMKMEIPYAKTRYFAGLIYRDMGRDEEAIRYFSEALKLQPRFKAVAEQLSFVIGRYCTKELKNRFDISAQVSAKVAQATLVVKTAAISALQYCFDYVEITSMAA